jgi:hypothetical protein
MDSNKITLYAVDLYENNRCSTKYFWFGSVYGDITDDDYTLGHSIMGETPEEMAQSLAEEMQRYRNQQLTRMRTPSYTLENAEIRTGAHRTGSDFIVRPLTNGELWLFDSALIELLDQDYKELAQPNYEINIDQTLIGEMFYDRQKNLQPKKVYPMETHEFAQN